MFKRSVHTRLGDLTARELMTGPTKKNDPPPPRPRQDLGRGAEEGHIGEEGSPRIANGDQGSREMNYDRT